MLRGIGWPELLIVLMIVLLLFGGRLTRVAGDLAKGIKIFRRNLQEEEKPDLADDVENDLPKS